jgi:hypothetical protein
MAGSETTYTARFIGPEILEAGRNNVVSCPIYNAGALVTPASGVLTIYDPQNVAISAGSVTVVGGVAQATVTASALSANQPGDGWRFEWALTISGTAYTFRRDGSLVYRRLYPVVTDADLLRSHTDLARRMPTTETSYQDYLDEAWARIESQLINTGKRPWLIMAPSALRDCHTYQTLVLIFRDFATGGPGSAEWEMMLHYEALLERAWGVLSYPQCEPTTGKAEGTPGARTSPTGTMWAGSRRNGGWWV